MTDSSGPPFRADHVGSLLRPQALLDARARFAAGEIDAAELRGVEDSAIADVVRLQGDVGLHTATDGEFRRATWHMDFIYAINGITKVEGEGRPVHFHNADGDIDWVPAGLHVDGPLSIDEPIFGADFAYLQSLVGEGQTAKLTIPSPSMVHYRGGAAAIDPAVYPDEDAFWDALSAAYRQQVQGIAAQGCTYLQLDDTSLAYLNDPAQRAELAEQGRDAEHQHERYIRQINAALAGRPEGLAVTTHLCRGNFRSSWVAEGGYDFVAEALFGGLDVDGFFLEYDDARSGGFEPLRFVPPGKRVVLGLVTSKRPQLEDKDQLKRRIDEAAAYVPLDQLAISPQCGFSSTVEGNALTRDEQIAKLALVVETAQEVWGY
ncbi:5-methyltetrahydropteroyltriglutamate--homocysteine S-methyltransferase [Geodermatophilus sabuli]|uniref:5-methyltetrahydropteroyltriglutamate--homocysteine methyltransferase n=1 Tax=Geodermatophilus sabuli TaxID=1564158 RepID=A0A285E7D3_9ACTN|nr:5-methyltetrahydropteroyltriglutamate--homocysteine S-methyltransferase [Geodermatophilus sabuli]MBB3082202.1 5-methyltetrahydropteroyltriglutamate--homocysteine methyltransferase [Geodermatophilus sabuli]SNX94925.1 5-methyltetrahydropteroyltriglutamate--homocysteine methyltransferase [Geodermatophilus sabuli]